MKKGKTIEEAMPELQRIANEMELKVNDGRVLQEYFKQQKSEI